METTFDGLGLMAPLVDVVRELGFARPTPIQSAAIPPLLAGRDLLGRSKTGSGKTAAFGLPLLQGLELERRAPQALVLCPTRELAGQVARELRKLGRGLAGLRVLELIGGQPARAQRDALTRGAHVAVGTPGRLRDHLQTGALDPAGIRLVVLDEADRMLDMGFADEVDAILQELPRQRQTALFSATLPEAIEALGAAALRAAVQVHIEADDQPAEGIHQLYQVVNAEAKLAALAGLLQSYPHESVLIFCNFKASVRELDKALRGAGLSVARLDGDLDQPEREEVLVRFRNQSLRVLVATDVAGRGLDVEGLDLVINYELPSHAEVYVHRVGRTGRAGRAGVAISLVTERQTTRLEEIESLTGQQLERLADRGGRGRDSGAELRALARKPKMATVLIRGGRRDKLRPGDILGALTGKAGGLSGSEVGKIEVHDRISFVAVARGQAHEAVARINRGQIKNKRFRASLAGPGSIA